MPTRRREKIDFTQPFNRRNNRYVGKKTSGLDARGNGRKVVSKHGGFADK